MAKVEIKQPIVEEIAGNLDGALGVVLCEYRGLTVEQDTQLRKNLREEGVIYKVYKNTLVKRAIEGGQFESLKDDLTGPTAIAISDKDPAAPARILAKFAKEADALVLKSGVVEGTYYDKAGIEQLASIPSREELLSKLLGSLQSPIANFARVVAQIAEKGGEVPAEETADAAPAAEAPAEEAAPAEAPAEEATAEAAAEAPAEEVPVEAAPEAEAPAEESAAEESAETAAEAAVSEAPAEEAPAEAPAEESAEAEAPAEAPAEEKTEE